MFRTHLQWRKEFGTDELDSFVFHERDAFISLYPQGYHKTDKLVSCAVHRVQPRAVICLEFKVVKVVHQQCIVPLH